LSSLLSAEPGPEPDSLVLASIFVFFVVVVVVLALFSGLGRNHRGLKLLPVQRLKDREATAF